MHVRLRVCAFVFTCVPVSLILPPSLLSFIYNINLPVSAGSPVGLLLHRPWPAARAQGCDMNDCAHLMPDCLPAMQCNALPRNGTGLT